MLHTYRSSGWRLARQKVLLSLETCFRWKLFNSRSYFGFRKLFVKAKRPNIYDTLSFQSISKLYVCFLKASCCILLTIVESFYSVKYGLSIITSNVHQIISVMKTKKHWCLQRKDTSKIVHLGILIHILSWNIYFRLLKKKYKLKLFEGIIDVIFFDGVKRLCYWVSISIQICLLDITLQSLEQLCQQSQ